MPERYPCLNIDRIVTIPGADPARVTTLLAGARSPPPAASDIRPTPNPHPTPPQAARAACRHA
ncbi:hypothetical protein GCM10010206_59940 [Streptomyces cinerochromogenes]|nr:hypothetical protein GCM10010206_59940 [Streptomyces cinerochromogenes]